MSDDSQILIVEDNIIVAEDIRRSLLKRGYGIFGVSNSYQEATELLERRLPDLVLLDISLEGEKTGIDVARKIRQSMDIPVVFVTAHSDEKTLQEAQDTSPYGYLIKPFKTRELYTVVEVALYRHRLEKRIREREALLFTTLRSIGDAVITTDMEDRILFANPVATKLIGRSEAEMLGLPVRDVLVFHTDESAEKLVSHGSEVLSNGEIRELAPRSILVRQDGRRIPVENNEARITDDDHDVRGTVFVFRDVTEKRRAARAVKEALDMLENRVEERTRELASTNSDLQTKIIRLRAAQETIRKQAFYDPVTGLPNKQLFRDRLINALSGAQRRQEKMVVLHLGLDRFKDMNEMLGHSGADLLLQHASIRLREILRDDDTIARHSGDEFMILLPGLRDLKDILSVGEKIRRGMEKPWAINGGEYYVSVTIGISVFPEDSTDADQLIKNAKTAMYQAKESGRNNLGLFTPTMQTGARERLRMEQRLHRAVENGDFELQYQPQVGMSNRNLLGLEVLVRWRDEELGLVQPSRFIPLAEESSLIARIGEWVLRTACLQMRGWLNAGMRIPGIAVNISARQFLQPDFGKKVIGILQETDLPAECLELEITESTVMNRVDDTIERLNKLHREGIRIAIDDFGTGYSSLYYLKEFPLHKLKIDRSFIRDITKDSAGAMITMTIISLARNLNLDLIAEGVETEGQWNLLQEWQCGGVQGYYYCPPLNPRDIEEIFCPQ